jgi:hypothetical protein
MNILDPIEGFVNSVAAFIQDPDDRRGMQWLHRYVTSRRIKTCIVQERWTAKNNFNVHARAESAFRAKNHRKSTCL